MDVTVIGIDPGGAHCGYAEVRYDGHDVTLGVWGEVALSTAKGRTALRAVLAAHPEAAVACERPYFDVAHARGPRIGARIRAGQAATRARVEEMAEAAGLAVLPDVPTSTAKAALCHGGASKEMMQRAAVARFGVEMSEHAADAAAVALAAIKQAARVGGGRRH